MPSGKNIRGTKLKICCESPVTGFYRDGCCNTGPGDIGLHIVCAEMTDAFLQFSARRGNDLITPNPAMGFPGLKAGDRWCLCVSRWKEALEAGVAPPLDLDATHISTLEFIDESDLLAHAIETQK